MKRLVLILTMLGASVTAVPAAEKIYRLGFLEPTAAAAEITRSVMLPELATLGFREQVNLAIDERVGDAVAFPRLAQELVLSRPDAIEALLDGCHVDLDLAIPRLDGERRAAVRAALTPLRLDDLHHIVEVDPRAGVGDGSSPTLDDLGAAAAGVLAGRLAAGRRRFLDDRG